MPTSLYPIYVYNVNMAESNRPTYHHGTLREALVQAALNAIERSRPEDLSLRQLARKLNVSPNAPYRHFTDREQLLQAVAAEGHDRLTQSFYALGPDPTVEAIGQAYITFADQHPNLWQHMFACPLDEDKQLKASESFNVLLEAIARRTQTPPDHPNTFESALAAWSLVHGIATLRIQSPPQIAALLHPDHLEHHLAALNRISNPPPSIPEKKK